VQEAERTATDKQILARRATSKQPAGNLYEIEVLKEDYRVKVHYVGYSSIYDERIRKSSIWYNLSHPVQAASHLSDDGDVFSSLGSVVKQKLFPSWTEYPLVRIQLSCSKRNFQLIKGKGKSMGKH